MEVNKIKEISKIQNGHKDEITCSCTFTKNGQNMLITAGMDLSLRIYNLNEMKEVLVIEDVHSDGILKIAMLETEEGHIAITASKDCNIGVTNIDTLSKNQIQGAHDGGEVTDLTILKKGNESFLVSIGLDDYAIVVRNTKDWNRVQRIRKAHKDDIYCLTLITINNETFLVTASNDLSIKVWNTQNIKEFTEVKHILKAGSEDGYPIRYLDTITFNNEELLVSGTLYEFSLWNPKTWEKSLTMPKSHEHYVTACAFNTNNSVLVTSDLEGTIKIWKNESNGAEFNLNLISTFEKVHEKGCTCLQLIDGGFISVGNDKEIRVWK